eukprot:365325-Chlamydomonas_euryale.AAC.1
MHDPCSLLLADVPGTGGRVDKLLAARASAATSAAAAAAPGSAGGSGAEPRAPGPRRPEAGRAARRGVGGGLGWSLGGGSLNGSGRSGSAAAAGCVLEGNVITVKRQLRDCGFPAVVVDAGPTSQSPLDPHVCAFGGGGVRKRTGGWEVNIP